MTGRRGRDLIAALTTAKVLRSYCAPLHFACRLLRAVASGIEHLSQVTTGELARSGLHIAVSFVSPVHAAHLKFRFLRFSIFGQPSMP